MVEVVGSIPIAPTNKNVGMIGFAVIVFELVMVYFQ